MSDSLRPHGLQHARLSCPSPTPRVYPNSCPLSRWCHPTISSSVIPFSSHLQSFPASGFLQMSQFFTSGGQSTGVSASTSVLPMNTQDWSLGWTGWILVLAYTYWALIICQILNQVLHILISWSLQRYYVKLMRVNLVQGTKVWSLGISGISIISKFARNAASRVPTRTFQIRDPGRSAPPWGPAICALPSSEGDPDIQALNWGDTCPGFSRASSELRLKS